MPIQKAMSRLDKLAANCDCLVVNTKKKAPVYVDGAMVGVGPRVVLPAEEKTYEILVVIDGEPTKKTIEWPKTKEVRIE